MSNYLSIAVVTATIHEIVQAAVLQAVPGASVRVGPPRAAAPGDKEVNIYLYRLSPNAYNRNNDLPTRGADGTLARQPQEALELHYVISFSGEDHLETEIMLGKVMTVLHEVPLLTPEELGRVIRPGGSFPFLEASDLPAQPDRIKLTPEYLSLDELSKLWTTFFQLAHRPSIQYVVTPVILDSAAIPEPVRLVRTVDVETSTEV